MHQRRALGDRCLEVDDRWQLFKLDDDRVGCSPRLFGRAGRDRSDDLTLEADRAVGEQPPIGNHRAVVRVGHVFGGDDGDHTRHRLSKRRVDADQSGVGNVGVFERRKRHAGE